MRRVENMIPYLLHRAAQRADWHVERSLAPLKITARQFSVLDAVQRSPGLSQIELGASRGIDRSTVVNIIDRLEGRGMVVRADALYDRRAVALQLSPDGEEIIARARPLVEAVHVRLLSSLPEHLRPEVHGLLLALIEAGP